MINHQFIYIALFVGLIAGHSAKAQSLFYYPAGNKAWEKNGDVIRFFDARGECIRYTDLKKMVRWDKKRAFPYWEYAMHTDEVADGYLTYLSSFSKSGYGTDYARYNEMGLVTRYLSLGPTMGREVEQNLTLTYDKCGLFKRRITYDRYGNELRELDRPFFYNDRHLLVRREDGEKRTVESYYNYDAEDRLIEEYTYDFTLERITQYVRYIHLPDGFVKMSFTFRETWVKPNIWIIKTTTTPQLTNRLHSHVSIEHEPVIQYTREDFERLFAGVFDGSAENLPGENRDYEQIHYENGQIKRYGHISDGVFFPELIYHYDELGRLDKTVRTEYTIEKNEMIPCNEDTHYFYYKDNLPEWLDLNEVFERFRPRRLRPDGLGFEYDN
ncbi:MAG: hypothetical protein LBU84_15030 [Prevotella sp.]|jgi:YD repeat-containing protein|nr:hypothetical protein [Prevotella sp.]